MEFILERCFTIRFEDLNLCTQRRAHFEWGLRVAVEGSKGLAAKRAAALWARQLVYVLGFVWHVLGIA